ncbi:ABC transporter ATP-binding protein [Aquicella lusitana]|uniref:ABC-2 type transport system ATP-binding protein n=1 Tax=Aquicella lusitana TaxID=254246 RepID=A0A370GT88_9COXI|nr:ABC transporter ATP-binding protein [Aquicella lusitana]RDI46907.1 ABC-2 type transport system ATP-binding protein [Aquicella lusitana]VVC73798.1 putative ABC transporter ATP-binding protein YbhF [Aquicella lusitana]
MTTTDEYVIDVRDLTKSFNGKRAVNHVSLQVRRGEIFGFLGPNGSGKTTTIRMLCGLMTPDSGEGECLGYDILRETRMIKPLVGYVPQIFSLYQDMTVRENLEFVSRMYGEKDYASRTKKMMADLELDKFENVLAGRLSGGWKQRLSLGAALIHDPKLLLLDEPTAGVDPKARREFWNYISNLTSQGITSLVSTHYMDEAERCNRLAYIVYGDLMAQGTIPEIINHAGLITWAATGRHLTRLAEALQNQPGIEQVIAWGNELRICGTDLDLIQQAVNRFPDYKWEEVPTNLEAVFIHLVAERTGG